MKKCGIWAGLLFLATGCHFPPEEIGVVDDGRGTVRLSGSETWKTAEYASILVEGDELKTGRTESLALNLEDGLLVMNENTHLALGERTAEGFRRASYLGGDLFVMAESSPARGFHLVTGAGDILIRKGSAILRIDTLTPPERKSEGPGEVRLQAVTVGGEVVLENLGLARTLTRGQAAILSTGEAPTPPTSLPEEVIQDYEWILDQALGRQPRPAWSRPPLHAAPKRVEPEEAAEPPAKGEKEGD